jgi:hypothetical protein
MSEIKGHPVAGFSSGVRQRNRDRDSSALYATASLKEMKSIDERETD